MLAGWELKRQLWIRRRKYKMELNAWIKMKFVRAVTRLLSLPQLPLGFRTFSFLWPKKDFTNRGINVEVASGSPKAKHISVIIVVFFTIILSFFYLTEYLFSSFIYLLVYLSISLFIYQSVYTFGWWLL